MKKIVISFAMILLSCVFVLAGCGGNKGLDDDWIYNNVLIAPAGSILYGKVTDSQKAGYAYGNGEIEITFNELLTTEGQKFNLAANKVKLR